MRTRSACLTLPRPTRSAALVLEADEIEDLPAGDHHGIAQVDVQSRELAEIELPESLLVETVESLDLQGPAIVQHDVEQQRSQQIERQHGRDELFGRLLARDQFTQDREDFLEVRGVAAVRIDERAV